MEREKDRERFHLIDKEFCLQVVLNLASQPLTPMWTGNALVGTLKSRRSGQRTGVTSKQLNFSKRPQIMLRYSGSAKKKGEGIAGHKTANIKVFIKSVEHYKKKYILKMLKKTLSAEHALRQVKRLVEKGALSES